MDQRREPRFVAEQAVAVTVFGAQEMRQSAIVKNASARGLALEMSEPVPPGTALKIEFDDGAVLGEAVYCRSTPGSHLVRVELDQVLCGLTELGKKLQEFAEAAGPACQASYVLKPRPGRNLQPPPNQ